MPRKPIPRLERIVVAIDPAMNAKKSDSDNIAETGISVCGIDAVG